MKTFANLTRSRENDNNNNKGQQTTHNRQCCNEKLRKKSDNNNSQYAESSQQSAVKKLKVKHLKVANNNTQLQQKQQILIPAICWKKTNKHFPYSYIYVYRKQSYIP